MYSLIQIWYLGHQSLKHQTLSVRYNQVNTVAPSYYWVDIALHECLYTAAVNLKALDTVWNRSWLLKWPLLWATLQMLLVIIIVVNSFLET